jgi:uncharacterized membrane protein
MLSEVSTVSDFTGKTYCWIIIIIIIIIIISIVISHYTYPRSSPSGISQAYNKINCDFRPSVTGCDMQERIDGKNICENCREIAAVKHFRLIFKGYSSLSAEFS